MITSNKTSYMQRISNLLPIGGGAGGALSQSSYVISNITLVTAIDTILIAAIGALVGYFVKLLLDYLLKKGVFKINEIGKFRTFQKKEKNKK